MHRSSLIALLLASLLVLAGCTGTTNSGASGTDAPETPTATSTAPPTATATATPEPAVTPGAIDAEAVAERHVAALRSAGSFTLNQSVSVEAVNESALDHELAGMFSSSRTATVDLDAGKGLMVSRTLGIETATYVDFEAKQTVVRYNDSEGSVSETYDAVDPAFETDAGNATGRAYGQQSVEAWLTHVDFAVVGVEETDGRHLTRLEADGVAAHSGMTVLNESVYERMHTTLLLDEDGVVREIHHEQTINLTGEPMNSSTTIRWTDLGSTSVEEPDWLDEARESANETTASATESTA